VLDSNFIGTGGISAWNGAANELTINNVVLPEIGAEEKNVRYSVGYNGNYMDTQTFKMNPETLEPLAVKSAVMIKYVTLEIKLGQVPAGYRPYLSAISVKRYIKGVLDTNYVWSGSGTSGWNSSSSVLTAHYLPYSEGVTYEVSDNPNDNMDFIVEEVIQKIKDNLNVRFNRMPENVKSTPLIIKRIVNGNATDITGFSINFNPTYGKVIAGDINPEKRSYEEAKTIVYSVLTGSTPAVSTTPFVLEVKEIPQGFAVNMDKSNATLNIAQTLQLSAVVSPDSVVNKSVTWSVSSQSAYNVAMVSSDGLVTGLNPGTALIRTTSSEIPSYYAECTVTVVGTNEPRIITVTSGNYSNISVYLKSTTTSKPTGNMFNIIRKINGVEDDSFIWKGGTSRWYSADKLLIIESLPYIQGGEYIVTDKADDDIINEINDTTQLNASNLKVTFNKVPSTSVTASTVNVKRYINDVLDPNFIWNGGASSWDSNTNELRINYIGLPEAGTEEKNVRYSVGYDGNYVDTQAFKIVPEILEALAVKSVALIKYVNLEIKLSQVPAGYRPYLSAIDVKRYINGVLDTNYVWSGGGYSGWNSSDSRLTAYFLPYSEGVSYEIVDKPNDGMDLIIEEVTQKVKDNFNIRFNRMPENLYSVPITINRSVNGNISEITEYSRYFDMNNWRFLATDIVPVEKSYQEVKTVIYSISTGSTPAVSTTPFTIEKGELLNYNVPGGQLLFDPAIGTIIGFTGSPTNIEIPSQIGGVNVTTIGESAFKDCPATRIIIPNSVTSILKKAFIYCHKLTNITIPDSVISIDDNAFWNCSSLTDVTIPSSVNSIGRGAFGASHLLSSITVDNNNGTYTSEEGVLFNKAKTQLIQYPIARKSESYIIPSSVKEIGSLAFYTNNSLRSITIPEGVTTIKDSAFGYLTSLTGVIIPSSVTSIEFRAFYNCKQLSSVYFYGDAPSVDSSVFQDTMAGFTVYHKADKIGFTNPWNGYQTATFENTYKVTVSALNGSFTGLLPVYRNGETVRLTTVPDNGYIFVSWSDKSGNLLSFNNNYSFTINSDMELKANFADQCDVDKNGEVTILDLEEVSKNYNSNITQPNWNSKYDFNKDSS
jgi:hypothetical protein